MIHDDAMDIELPERVDVIVSEWLGGFGIDEGMLVPVIAVCDRRLKPGGIMIPRSVTAWVALVHDRHLAETMAFLQDTPYGLRFDDLVDKTVNEISYSGSFRHLAASDKRSDVSRLWTTDAAGSRSNRRKRRTKRKLGSLFANVEPRTCSRSGSARSSRPASRSRSDRVLHQRTGE